MSSIGLRSLNFKNKDRRRSDRSRASRRFRFGLEIQVLENRITPTSVTGVVPDFGPAAGGTMVTITGTGFTGVTAVDFGATPAASDTVVSATEITAESPAGKGAVDVTVTATGGTSPITPDDVFTYAPIVSSLSPAFGPAAGGTLVTITGSGFTHASSVDFGANAATSLTVVSDTSINAESPAGTDMVDVTVMTPAGTSAISPDDVFTYAPTVSGLTPAIGPAAGGTLVTITGTGFTSATAVDFGTTAAASYTVVDSTSITAESPAGTDAVDVTVTTAAGTSPTSPADVFTYAPTVSGLVPSSGPAAGGTTVTITGTGFNGATAVDFGTTPATSYTVVSSTSIMAASPPGADTVDVTVMTAAGTSPIVTADQFTYAPTVSSLTPAIGPAAGGTLVTITGTGFTGATAVDFGTTAATSYTVVDSTSITAESPAGAGAVDVTVTTAAGTSPTSPADVFTYAPTVSGLVPSSGPAAGGTMVTITGTGFTGTTAVDFGTTPATTFTVVSSTSIMAASPPGTGTVDVTVTTGAGASPTLPADQFEYIAAPVVTSLSPLAGPLAGGTLVTITGTGFTGATSVHFGTNLATNLTFVSDTSIKVDSPAGTGTVNVTVTTPGGTSAISMADQFTYGPTVTGINPAAGPLGGGTLVTITGTGFTGATAVNFGAFAATIMTVSAGSITAYSPAGTGTVDVTVTTPLGTSVTSPVDQFTYVAAPTVSGISPTMGPLAGGTFVTITGTGFTLATMVDFGPNAATNLTVVNDMTLTVDSPAGTGTVDVTVTTPGGKSAASAADQFTYVAAPAVSGVSPSFGPAAGGTPVTISGSGFIGATAVDFGTTSTMDFTIVSDSSITVDSLPGTGTVDVTVTTPGGRSATSMADQFTYAPTVSSVSPADGVTAGGTMVTITGTGFNTVTEVDFGMTAATNLTILSATSLTVDSPPGTGTVNVTVTSPSGTSAISMADQFTYLAVPAVTGVSPNIGPAVGGTMVTITGLGLTGATAVEFGANAATDVTVVNDTTITALSPAGEGPVDVRVTTPGGISAISPADHFTYAPTVTSISPTFGPPTGGTAVTIEGDSFLNATAVDFGTTPALSFTIENENHIVAVSPPGTDAVYITVTGPSGTSTTSPANLFTYAPAVTNVVPSSGTANGGNLVTITGTGFTGATAVDFGTMPAAIVISVTPTAIEAVTPASAVFGAVDVTVTTMNGGTSATSPADQFFYFSPGAVAPRVTSISPSFGAPTGGNVVTITGSGFGVNTSNPLQVFFGANQATDVTVVNSTTVTAVSPPGTGTVNVTVFTSGGSSAPSTADQFTYVVNGPQVALVQRVWLPLTADVPGHHIQRSPRSLAGPACVELCARRADWQADQGEVSHLQRVDRCGHPGTVAASESSQYLPPDNQWHVPVRAEESERGVSGRRGHRRAGDQPCHVDHPE